MFGTIRRHQKWLWILISGLTIISFVVFFSPNRRRQGGWTSPHDLVGSINGRPITRDQYADVYREARLRYLFSYGSWPDEDTANRQRDMMDAEVRNRLFLIEKMREMGIHPGESAVAEWIVQNPAFHDPTDKRFRKEAYEQFVSSALPSHGISQGDFERFARHEVGIQHLVNLAGTGGKLVTPQEAESLFRRENQEVEAEAVFVSSSNYLSQVTVDPAALATYYTNQQAVYRIPEKIEVSYVKFAASNYVAEADQVLAKQTNLNQLVENDYLRRGTNAFNDTNNAPLSAEAAKQKIREEARQNVALEEAKKKAVEFANELFELKDKTDGLDKLAAAKGLVSEVTPPFVPYQPPSNMKLPPGFAQAAAKLTPEDPFAEQLIQGDDAIYIIALKRKTPSEVPPLDQIRQRLEQDYRNSKAAELARAAGKELHNAITNGVAQGKTFEAVAAETKTSPIILPPFSRDAQSLPGIPNSGDISQLVSKAFTVVPGKVSEFVPTRTGGFLVYVKGIIPVTETKVKSELPEFTKKLRQARQYEAFVEWFRAQESKAQIVLPGDRQKQRASAR